MDKLQVGWQDHRAMHTFPCPACDRETSSEASICPHCGHPIKAGELPKGCGVMVLVAILAGIAMLVAKAISLSRSY